jgi:hypothetical protein
LAFANYTACIGRHKKAASLGMLMHFYICKGPSFPIISDLKMPEQVIYLAPETKKPNLVGWAKSLISLG